MFGCIEPNWRTMVAHVFSHLKRLAWSNKTLYQETCFSALPLHKQTPETPAGCAIYMYICLLASVHFF